MVLIISKSHHFRSFCFCIWFDDNIRDQFFQVVVNQIVVFVFLAFLYIYMYIVMFCLSVFCNYFLCCYLLVTWVLLLLFYEPLQFFFFSVCVSLGGINKYTRARIHIPVYLFIHIIHICIIFLLLFAFNKIFLAFFGNSTLSFPLRFYSFFFYFIFVCSLENHVTI